MELRHLREKNNLSRAEAAELLGVKRNTLKKYECSINLPSLKVILKMTQIYKTDYETIITVYENHKKIFESKK